MAKTNVAGLILEGIAGTGKTSVLYEILKSDFWRNKPFISSYVLSEHHTLRVLENKHLEKTLQKDDSVNLLGAHVSYLESLQSRLDDTDWLERDRKAQTLPFIFERFHLTHAYHYDQVEWTDVTDVDERLKALNASLVLLTISPEDVKDRIIEDYKKAGWQDYLETLGSNDKEITAHFMNTQEELLSLGSKTNLPLTIIDSSKSTPTEIAQQIIGAWDLY